MSEQKAFAEYNALLKSGQLGAADDLISKSIAAGGRAESLYREWVRIASLRNLPKIAKERLSRAEALIPQSNWSLARALVHRRAREFREALIALERLRPLLTTDVQRQELAELERDLVQSQEFAEGFARRDEAGPRIPYEAFGINLDLDGDRWQQLTAQFGASAPALRRVPGVPGRYLPDVAVGRLGKRVSSQLKGTLGCFLGHVAAWEAFLATEHQAALVVEDDTTFRYALPQSVTAFGVPENYDYCFISAGMAASAGPRPGAATEFVSVPVAQAIRALWSTVRVPGTQGYLLSRAGAETLLRRTEEDGFFGDVDWRLVAYCMERESLENLPQSTFAHQALTAQFDVIASRPPMRGYALSPGIAFPGAWGSVRIAANRWKLHAHLT